MHKYTLAVILFLVTSLSVASLFAMTPMGFSFAIRITGETVDGYYVMLAARAAAVVSFLVIYILSRSMTVKSYAVKCGYVVWMKAVLFISFIGLVMAAIIMGGVG